MNKESLLELFKRGNSIGEHFCRNYDSFFSQKVGEKTDYSELTNQLFHTTNASKYLIDDIGGALDYFKDNNSVIRALYALEQYIVCTSESAALFNEIVQKLCEKSGGKLFTYPFRQYRKDSTKLEKMHQYQELLKSDLASGYLDLYAHLGELY